MSPINIEVTARGKVSKRARAEARKKLDRLEGLSKGPVLGARVMLIQEPNPRIALPPRAEAEINLQGRLVRAAPPPRRWRPRWMTWPSGCSASSEGMWTVL